MSEHFKDLLYSTQGQNAQYNYPEDSLCGKVPTPFNLLSALNVRIKNEPC